jgi:hypothetical protein
MIWLFQKDSSKRSRGFADFFPLDNASFQNHINIISMEEFLEREGGIDGRFPIPSESKEAVLNGAKFCRKMKKSEYILNQYEMYCVMS